jgi:hypothetical protein
VSCFWSWVTELKLPRQFHRSHVEAQQCPNSPHTDPPSSRKQSRKVSKALPRPSRVHSRRSAKHSLPHACRHLCPMTTSLRSHLPLCMSTAVTTLMRTCPTMRVPRCNWVCLPLTALVDSYTQIHSEKLKHTWRSSIYSFFKAEVTIQTHDGRPCHFFVCAAPRCKTSAGGVRRFQDSKDKASPANLKNHATKWFGAEAVANAAKGSDVKGQSASIFALFARPGQQPVRYSHRSHTNVEAR